MAAQSSSNSSQLTSDEQNKLRAVFSAFDEHNEGVIQASELGKVMKLLKIPVTEEELKTMRASILGGTVDFESFVELMSQNNRMQSSTADDQSEQEMRQAFKAFDVDGNGYIDTQELKSTMRNLGQKRIKDDEVAGMMKSADKNHDGKIDYEEFIKLCYGK